MRCRWPWVTDHGARRTPDVSRHSAHGPFGNRERHVGPSLVVGEDPLCPEIVSLPGCRKPAARPMIVELSMQPQTPRPLAAEVEDLVRWWRAANYLFVGQI